MRVYRKTKLKELSEELQFVQEALWDVLAEMIEYSLPEGQHSLH
jgi:hypothetical protein